MDPRKHGLLSVLPELRNQIYTYLFDSRDCILLSPLTCTNIPGLVLLRTCKQVHHEAASLFYAVNSSQCYIRKTVLVQSASEASIQLPDATSSISHKFFRDPLAIRGGTFFPAPRYHRYLTRLTMYFKALIRDLSFPDPEKGYWKDRTCVGLDSDRPIRLGSDNAAITAADMGKIQQAIEHEVFRVYQKMKSLWRKKEGTWAGKVIMPARSTATDKLEYWIELTAGEGLTHQ